jgi:arginase
MTLRNQAVADAVAKARRPLLLAGDCTVGLGMVAGLQRRHSQVGVVWLDAHGDFNTPAITTSGYLAGMSLALLTGRAPELDCDLLGLRPVPAEHRAASRRAKDHAGAAVRPATSRYPA